MPAGITNQLVRHTGRSQPALFFGDSLPRYEPVLLTNDDDERRPLATQVELWREKAAPHDCARRLNATAGDPSSGGRGPLRESEHDHSRRRDAGEDALGDTI